MERAQKTSEGDNYNSLIASDQKKKPSLAACRTQHNDPRQKVDREENHYIKECGKAD